MARTLAACTLPALAISIAWMRIESPVVANDILVVAALAVAPALLPWVWARWLGSAVAAAAAIWLAFGTEAWEVLPGRGERVAQPLAESVGQGLADFYRVLLPFDPAATPEMHGLVLIAIFGFLLAVSLLVASGGRWRRLP